MTETLIEFTPNQTIPAMTRATYERILKSDSPVDLASLYVFYCYTIGWQGTSQIRATDGYVAKALKSSREYVSKHRRALEELGLVKLVQENEDGAFGKCYVRVFYVATTAVGISDTAHDNRCRKNPVAVNSSTNAYELCNGNALELCNVQQAAKEPSSDQSEEERTTSRPIESKCSDKTPSVADPLLLDAPPRRFSPPRLDEAEGYFKALGLNGASQQQAEAFVNHHAARGWMLGRTKMKDWKAAARTWKMNFERFNAPASPVVASPAKMAAERQMSEKEKRDAYQRELEARLLKQGGAK